MFCAVYRWSMQTLVIGLYPPAVHVSTVHTLHAVVVGLSVEDLSLCVKVIQRVQC